LPDRVDDEIDCTEAAEPAPAVTLCPTVIVEGALCASNNAPGATSTLPVTLITASVATLHTPAT
jgi:hypothetical protein